MAFYTALSNCGRSIILPCIWLVVWNFGSYKLYSGLIEGTLTIDVKNALYGLTFASMLPFGATARPTFQSAVKFLFEQSDGRIIIPTDIQVVSSLQGLGNIILVFLLGLAIRNHFRLK